MASSLTPLPYTDGCEHVPPEEPHDIQRILEVMRQTLRRQFDAAGVFRRDVHVKGHGSPVGEFRIRQGLPVDLAQGLFAEARTYPAALRFSNSAPGVQPDVVPDARGLAIQVSGVAGEFLRVSGELGATQDFVLVNHPTFIARDVRDYLRLEELRLAANRQLVRTLAELIVGSANPLTWRWREIGAAIRVASQIPSHPARYTYYSMTPFRYGKYVAKFRVIPGAETAAKLPACSSTFLTRSDAMKQLLAQSLEAGPIEMEFQVQLRTSQTSMPIEDATVEWPERESRFRTVADVFLPAQKFPEVGDKAEERRAFNVWNALADHRPLGGINRSRRLAYELSAATRARQVLG